MMKRIIAVAASCWLLSTAGSVAAFADTPGSLRQAVQENFRRLLESGACPSCDLAGVDLTRVDLAGANLEAANLVGAKMFLANLAGANLRNANLQGAALGGADLAGADLRGANLTGVILEGAYLKGALMDGKIIERPADEEGKEVGGGEQVFLADEKRPKNMPLTQDVLVEDRQDFAETPPQPVQKPEEDDRQMLAPPVADDDTVPVESKKLVPMQEAVVPSVRQVETEAESAAQLKDTKKIPASRDDAAKKVSKSPTGEVPSAPEAKQDAMAAQEVPGVAPGSRVEEMISQMEEPTPPERIEARETGQTEGATAAMAEEEQTRDAADISESRPMAVPDDGPAGQSVEQAEAGAGIVNKATETGKQMLVYSVETPQEAQDRKQILRERLLEENSCLECDLAGLDLSGEDLEEADLERVNLQGADLRETDLSEANLKGADLRGADLRGADLREADLYQADLRGADLSGARLEGALLDSADLRGARGLEQGGQPEQP